MKKLSRKQAAVISAYTGILAGPFSDMQDYANEKLGRNVMTPEFGIREVVTALREATRADFRAICATEDEPKD